MKWNVICLKAMVFSILFMASNALGQDLKNVTPELLKQGETIYQKQCVICHGAEGKGDGEAAYLLFPKPRDFTNGTFKLRSTPTGDPPTDQDLFRTITDGIPGSMMPSFQYLSENQKWALVAYVKKLGDVTEQPERVIKVSAEPPVTPKNIAMGKELYNKLKCWECHGYEGRADGPSAPTLVDDWGYPIPPNNFNRGIYKGGGEDNDIYLRFTTGMDGTPMPSYEGSATEEERWALTHYVKSLAGPKVAVQPKTGTVIVGKKVSGKISLDPQNSMWDDVSAMDIPLMLLWQRDDGVIDSVSIKAVHNGKEIAFLLEWSDLKSQAHTLRPQDFADSAAVMFSLSPDAPLLDQPIFTMGEKGKPVNLWYWRMDRQSDLARFQDVEDLYTGMAVDDYQLERKTYIDAQEPQGKGRKKTDSPYLTPHISLSPAPAHDPVYITGWGAGNPLSIPARLSAVEDLNAEGFGTLTAQSQNDQDIEGRGLWGGGKWQVVFSRSLLNRGKFDIQLKPGSDYPIAFAIWNGMGGDRDGQKAVTTWYLLRLEDSK